MKKRILQILIILLYLILLTNCTSHNQELRLRIVASSNEEADQKLKIEVKEIVKNYLIDKNIRKLDLGLLQNYLEQNYQDHQIKVQRCKSNYEAKAYNGKIIQAGSYDTILITIDKGEGKNFWTLLYPEFFNISFEDDHEIEYRSFFYDLFNN